jgi:uncharacterized protein YkwD
MPRIAARIVALLLAIFLANPSAAEEGTNAETSALLVLLNDAREAAGEAPLVMQPALHAFASEWARELSSRQRLEHRSDTSQVDWIETNVTPQWKHLGENIALARSAREAHDVLMASAIHRANALGDFTHVGIGAARDGAGQLWVAYNFVTAPDLHEPDIAARSRVPVSSVPRRQDAAADRAIATVARTDPQAP